MSSNPKKKHSKSVSGPAAVRPDPQKRMSSITRKLHWYGIRKKLMRYFRMDLLFLVVLPAVWCAALEYARLGGLSPQNQRSLFVPDEARHLFYRVVSPTGGLLLSASVEKPFLFAAALAAGLFVLQILFCFLSYYREDRRIRAILAPINEIALKADELSRLSFSEDKYQQIEAALESIRPGQAVEDTPLSFHDSDLSGVEAAMNNLLLRMRDTYRQQSRFVNDASHELRTPIAVIQGYANMLDRWGKTDGKILEEGIGAIKNEAEHMNRLVEQLLFLARGDSGKTTLDKKQLFADSLLQEVYEECFMIDETHLYRLSLPDPPVALNGDPALLKQAVRILTDNAAKYTRQGDEILLSAGYTEKQEPYLQVQDEGIGMAEHEIPHIFERFFRSDEVRSQAGTGLGLSIAKWIVDKHKGHFEVLSREGLGTRIRIVLPALSEQDAVSAR